MRSSTWRATGVGGSGTRIDSGTACGLPLRTGHGLARSCGAFVGSRSGVAKAVVVASALAIMQLGFQQSFLFMILEVPVPVNRSDKFQQFAVVVGALCRKPSSLHRCSSGPSSGTMLVQQWIHVLQHFLGAFERVHTFLRQGGTSDSAAYLVLLSGRGLEQRAQSMLQLACRGMCTWKFRHYLLEPQVLGVALPGVLAHACTMNAPMTLP